MLPCFLDSAAERRNLKQGHAGVHCGCLQILRLLTLDTMLVVYLDGGCSGDASKVTVNPAVKDDGYLYVISCSFL